MYAIIKHLQSGEHAGAADELEKTLLKVRRPQEKKMQLMEWVAANVSCGRPATAAAAPLADASNAANVRPATAPPAKMQPPPSAVAEALGESAAPTSRAPAALSTPAFAALPDAAAVALVEQFGVAGRDHLSMSGAEMHGLVQWLKVRGHTEVEDLLLKVKQLGDKKFQLTQFLKKHAVELCEAVPPGPTHEPTTTTMQPAPVPEMAPPTPAAPMQQTWEAPPLPAEHHSEAPMAMAPPLSARGTVGADRALAQHIMMLGQTLDRMEETFNFQVDCMREDMKKAREQLHALSAAVSRR